MQLLYAPGHGLDLVLRWSGMGSVSECRSSPLKVPKIAMLLEIEQKLVNPQSLDKCSDSNHIETLKSLRYMMFLKVDLQGHVFFGQMIMIFQT